MPNTLGSWSSITSVSMGVLPWVGSSICMSFTRTMYGLRPFAVQFPITKSKSQSCLVRSCCAVCVELTISCVVRVWRSEVCAREWESGTLSDEDRLTLVCSLNSNRYGPYRTPLGPNDTHPSIHLLACLRCGLGLAFNRRLRTDK